MDQETTERIARLEDKIDAIQTSVEKTRKYLLVTVWVTVIFFVLPLIGLLFAIPAMLSMLTDTMNILSY